MSQDSTSKSCVAEVDIKILWLRRVAVVERVLSDSFWESKQPRAHSLDFTLRLPSDMRFHLRTHRASMTTTSEVRALRCIFLKLLVRNRSGFAFAGLTQKGPLR